MMRGRDPVYQSNHFATRLIVCVRPFVYLCNFSKRGNSHVSSTTPNIISIVYNIIIIVSLVHLYHVKLSFFANIVKKQ